MLHIPIPKVFAWSADANNDVGSEYIVMEEAPGQLVATIWESSELEYKVSIMKEIIGIEKKLTSIKFTRYFFYYDNGNSSLLLISPVVMAVCTTPMKRSMEFCPL